MGKGLGEALGPFHCTSPSEGLEDEKVQMTILKESPGSLNPCVLQQGVSGFQV